MGENGTGADIVATNKGILPRTLDELFRMSKWLLQSGLMPKQLDTPQKIMVAVQMGAEIGMTPTQAVQNIAVINGKPSVYGDAAIGVVWASGFLEDFKEEPIKDDGGVIGYRCTAKRKGAETPIVREFTIEDAKQAGLWGKKGPWQDYTARMLQMRARSWCLRDGFADALKGLCIAEEAMDIPDKTMRVEALTAERTEDLAAELEAATNGAEESPDSLEGESVPPASAPDDDLGLFDVTGTEFEE